MTETALITGATAGLGAEFARQLGAKHYNLVLVARDAERLATGAATLRQDFGVAVETIVADLETNDAVDRVAARLRQVRERITILVNNAGYGLPKPFDENTLDQESAHLRILVTTPMQLMHAALGVMLEHGHGRIINVASMAGFIPRGSYGACKAWLISFSRWANLEYGPRGVTMTAVCPGFVHTEFHQRMGASTRAIPEWMWLRPDRVVREGLADALSGKAVSIPSKRYALLAAGSRFVPAGLGAAAGRRGR
ncbi:SDR family NAD(P)-dependent oxidoreductase [Paenarthrobacter sp. Z7-10]|uniref:SDR family NAD(P)-dependent oxidoreductase n=1 Tax=Paenarthrobacter sp. Z7-10 TaxID=2787635 RepID=UPI0022A9EA22|nr:SDR family NAD(P)-dependent oxidoreductase [Paenarthrobacter sp. Z7-10]MCZ2403377.1 SDR family NAD(P)-dependent oxidoreductase [Paenarthrobacter sp. Z7-10]